MDYRRVYWLLFTGAGVCFTLLSALDYAAVGSLTVRLAIPLVLGLFIVGVSTYAAAFPDRAGGPTEPGVRVGIALVAFVILAILVLQRLLA